MPKSHAIKRRYKTKIHYPRWTIPGRDLIRTRCGKLLPPSMVTDSIPRITCKVCRHFFAYWRIREER